MPDTEIYGQRRNKLSDKIMPIDIISCILIIGCLILKSLGYNGTVSLILLSIVAYYYGSRKRHVDLAKV